MQNIGLSFPRAHGAELGAPHETFSFFTATYCLFLLRGAGQSLVLQGQAKRNAINLGIVATTRSISRKRSGYDVQHDIGATEINGSRPLLEECGLRFRGSVITDSAVEFYKQKMDNSQGEERRRIKQDLKDIRRQMRRNREEATREGKSLISVAEKPDSHVETAGPDTAPHIFVTTTKCAEKYADFPWALVLLAADSPLRPVDFPESKKPAAQAGALDRLCLSLFCKAQFVARVFVARVAA